MAAAGLGLALGCSAARPLRLDGAAPAGAVAAEYSAVLRSWTRSGSIYAGLDSRLFVSATLHAAELRHAFAAAFPDVHGRGGEITRRELVELPGGAEPTHTFFLAAYTPDVRCNDLARADSIWRLSLRGSGAAEVFPTEVVPVKVDDNLRLVYPFIGPFDRLYLVRFPRTDATQQQVLGPGSTAATLRLASALGAVSLRWELGG